MPFSWFVPIFTPNNSSLETGLLLSNLRWSWYMTPPTWETAVLILEACMEISGSDLICLALTSTDYNWWRQEEQLASLPILIGAAFRLRSMCVTSACSLLPLSPPDSRKSTKRIKKKQAFLAPLYCAVSEGGITWPGVCSLFFFPGPVHLPCFQCGAQIRQSP